MFETLFLLRHFARTWKCRQLINSTSMRYASDGTFIIIFNISFYCETLLLFTFVEQFQGKWKQTRQHLMPHCCAIYVFNKTNESGSFYSNLDKILWKYLIFWIYDFISIEIHFTFTLKLSHSWFSHSISFYSHNLNRRVRKKKKTRFKWTLI